MRQNERSLSRFAFSGKRLLLDASIIGALGYCQAWGFQLTGYGSRYAGLSLVTISLVLAFHIGKFLGAQRGTANI
jgi:hypothetical protein